MILGISSYTFGWAVAEHEMDVHALLDFARVEEVSVVQVCDNLPLIALSVAELSSVIAKARDLGITIELGMRHLSAENLAAHIKLAEQIGSPFLRFVIDGPNYHPTADEATHVLRSALMHLTHTSVTIGIENHDRFPARVLRRMVDTLDHPQVGICLDTANSLGAGEGIEHIIEHLAPVTVNLHIKDFQIARVPYLQGFTIEGRPAGQGTLDVPAVVESVKQHGKCQSAILELWVSPENSVEATLAKEIKWAQESLRYLRQALRSSPNDPGGERRGHLATTEKRALVHDRGR